MTSSVHSAATRSSKQDAEALAPADGVAGARLEQAVGPGHRAGLGGIEEAEQREGDQLAPAARPASPATAPSQKRRPRPRRSRPDRPCPGACAVTVQAHQPTASDSHEQHGPAAQSPSQRLQHAGTRPRPTACPRCRRPRRQAAAEAQRDQVRRVANMKPAVGAARRVARRWRQRQRCHHVVEVVEAARRLRRARGRRRRARASRAPASMRPMRLTATPASRAAARTASRRAGAAR